MLSWELFYPITCQKTCCFWQSSSIVSVKKILTTRELVSEMSLYTGKLSFLQIFENIQTQNFAFVSYNNFTLFFGPSKENCMVEK